MLCIWEDGYTTQEHPVSHHSGEFLVQVSALAHDDVLSFVPSGASVPDSIAAFQFRFSLRSVAGANVTVAVQSTLKESNVLRALIDAAGKGPRRVVYSEKVLDMEVQDAVKLFHTAFRVYGNEALLQFSINKHAFAYMHRHRAYARESDIATVCGFPYVLHDSGPNFVRILSGARQ